MNYIVCDSETGGFEGTSLLTVYFGILDNKLNLIDELYLYVKPDDGIYNVTAEALGVNKINLIEHEKTAIKYSEAKTKLFYFLKRYSEDGANKLVPLGHNVAFDIEKIKSCLISDGSWNQFVSYRKLDTGTIGAYLKILGKIPESISGSLSSYAKHFGVDATKAHDAKADCQITVEIFRRFLSL